MLCRPVCISAHDILRRQSEIVNKVDLKIGAKLIALQMELDVMWFRCYRVPIVLAACCCSVQVRRGAGAARGGGGEDTMVFEEYQRQVRADSRRAPATWP